MKIIDLHQDLIPHLKEREMFKNKFQTSFEMNAEAGLGIVTVTATPFLDTKKFNSTDELRVTGEYLKEYIDESEKRKIRIIKNKDDVDSSLRDQGIILHIEGLDCFNTVDNPIEILERWYDYGLRSVGLSWVNDTAFGGGTNGNNIGLTKLGKKVIEWIKNKNMILDFAHMSDQTFDDVARVWDKPIIVSHGACRALCDSVRNTTDEQLYKIKESGGIIGIFLAPKFINSLSSHASVSDVVKHMSYVKKLIGIDHVAFGSDLGGLVSGSIEGLDSVKKVDVLVDELKKNGFSNEDIEKIFHKNAERVIKKII